MLIIDMENTNLIDYNRNSIQNYDERFDRSMELSYYINQQQMLT